MALLLGSPLFGSVSHWLQSCNTATDTAFKRRPRVLLAKVLTTGMAEANQQLTSAGPSRSGAKDIEGVGKFKVSERASAQGFGLNS